MDRDEQIKTTAIMAATIIASKLQAMDDWNVDAVRKIAPNVVAIARELLAESEKQHVEGKPRTGTRFMKVPGI
jgi:hypothetical protein